MIKRVHEQVSIISSCDATTGLATPRRMRWHGQVYVITRVSSRIPLRRGRRLYHLFNAYAERSALTLEHDTETLGWTLEEMDDGWGHPLSPPPPGEQNRRTTADWARGGEVGHPLLRTCCSWSTRDVPKPARFPVFHVVGMHAHGVDDVVR